MNSDFILVRGKAPMWFWCGRNVWSTTLGEAKVIATRLGAERIIARRIVQGLWASVGYMTVEEAAERLAEKSHQ